MFSKHNLSEVIGKYCNSIYYWLYYLFLAVFGRRFWILLGGLVEMLPFCLTSSLIVSVFRPSVSLRFAGLSSGSFSSGRYRWLCSTDVVDEELSSSSLRRGRFDVVINLLFADFILRRRASVPSKFLPVKTIDTNFFILNNTIVSRAQRIRVERRRDFRS